MYHLMSAMSRRFAFITERLLPPCDIVFTPAIHEIILSAIFKVLYSDRKMQKRTLTPPNPSESVHNVVKNRYFMTKDNLGHIV